MRDNYGYSRICQSCGAQMVGVGRSRKWCDACRAAQYREQQRLRDRTKRASPPPPSTLDDDVKAAAAAGMSYGKYKAMQRMVKEE